MNRAERFAFEEAEKLLDAYAAHPARTAQFRRAYQRFKWAVYGVAHIDFGYDKRPDVLSLTHAWEDAQIAFLGYGEPSMTGCIIQMWASVPKGDKNGFERVVYAAFQAAEQATGENVHRRYMSQWRRKPVRRPEQGFTLAPVLPINGPRLRDWAKDIGKDAAVLEDQLYWLEKADREINGKQLKDVPEPKGTGPFLQLVPDREPTDEKERQ